MKSRSHRLPVTNPQDDWGDGSWTVDCVCGVNFDDGEEMVNCDECGVWVHTRCVRYVKSEKLFACDKCKNKVRRNDSEETEVAQLLVELPTKTLRMNPPYPNTSVPIRRPFRLWTELPMEERVHVQGVPGGDPALFTGLSSVFGPELWKCSGYVPKKFNFQYREFPCWENETREAHDDNTSDKVNDVAAGNGAGALFSLSKENRLFTPVANPVTEKPVIAPNNAIDSDATTRSMNDVKKDAVLPGPSVLPGSKRKKEEFGISKDRSGRKKSKIVEKEGYLKKDALASRPDRGPMAVKTDIQRSKSGNAQEVQPAVDILEGPRVENHATAGYSDIPTSSERLSKVASDVSKHCSTSEAHPREDKIRNHVPARVEDSHVENGGAATIPERRDSSSLPLSDEVVTNVIDNKEEVAVPSLGAESQVVEPVIENVTCLGPDIKRHQNVENSSDNKVICSSEHDTKLPAEVVHADGKLDITKSLLELAATSSGSMPEKAETNTTTTVNSENSDCKLEIGDRRAMNGDNSSNNGHKQSLKPAEDSPRSSLAAKNPLSAQNQLKVVVITENRTSSKSHNHDFSGRLSSHSNKRESSRDEEKCERLKKKLKELPRSSAKKTVSEAKESVLTSCAKTSTGRSNSATSRSAESSSASLQSESTSHVPNKTTGSQLTQKGEKSNQPSSQPSSKVNTHLMQPPSSAPAALSDEELALLLHQELNSSPRVPRVPRMRHAGSLPQLTSPTAASMLMKRTSSSGAKDNGLTARRKSKDIGKDGSNCSQEVLQETKKSERSSSPGCRREEDSVTKSERDSGSAKRVQSLKKSNDLAPNTSVSGVANEQNLSAADDAKVVGHASHRTLPGLLAEIMSKGERMTYEELCNAVLPHWPNLRKHNGERYAYSSHSQAVLDCLRNRSEWACLVDRGPKTTTSRKRRKHDADSSEDNDDCMDRSVKKDARNKTLESNQEEFPKGKRKARKRRRLALQGRRIKDVRRRHRAEVVSEEETESSESDEDSMFSEDEVQGGEAGNEASASSDEQATMS